MHYNRPPWDFDHVDELELYREAELLDVQREIRDRNRPGVYVPGVFKRKTASLFDMPADN